MRRLIGFADVSSVSAATLLCAMILARVGLALEHISLAALALGLALGFFAADVASGVVHWLCDTYFDASAPVIGPMVIAPFREHHVDPDALGRHGVLERNGNNCLASLPLLVAAVCSLHAGTRQTWDDVVSGLFIALGVTLCVTNQIHAWAHGGAVPRMVRALQRAGVLLAPERHARHHRGGRAYAVVCGWSNVFLDGAFAVVETALAALGLRPHEPRSPA
ncbi:MAG: fatty acid desaturase CarF family protein [Polyangiales bacterium]